MASLTPDTCPLTPGSRSVPIPGADPVHEPPLLGGQRLLAQAADLVEQFVEPGLVGGPLLGLLLDLPGSPGLHPPLDRPDPLGLRGRGVLEAQAGRADQAVDAGP